MSNAETLSFSQQRSAEQPEMLLVGIQTRTNNAAEATERGKIGPTIARFWRENMGEQIKNRTTPQRTFAVYTDYQTDANGDYTYFYGQQVDSIDHVPQGLSAIRIPAQRYQQFTTNSGPIPDVVIGAWQAIWQMNAEQLGGNRSFKADFEVYDERATDPSKTVIDVFIGID